jgi:hypothetical protein
VNGSLDLEKTTFERHSGINNVPTLASTSRGFGSKIVNWQKCKFSTLNLNETIWDQNEAHQKLFVDPLLPSGAAQLSNLKLPADSLPALFTLDEDTYVNADEYAPLIVGSM